MNQQTQQNLSGLRGLVLKLTAAAGIATSFTSCVTTGGSADPNPIIVPNGSGIFGNTYPNPVIIPNNPSFFGANPNPVIIPHSFNGLSFPANNYYNGNNCRPGQFIPNSSEANPNGTLFQAPSNSNPKGGYRRNPRSEAYPNG